MEEVLGAIEIDDHSVIPSTEWWIKLVGDKGQGLTNLAFNVINQEKPNSSLKHMMLFIYEADDSWYNMNTVFEASFL